MKDNLDFKLKSIILLFRDNRNEAAAFLEGSALRDRYGRDHRLAGMAFFRFYPVPISIHELLALIPLYPWKRCVCQNSEWFRKLKQIEKTSVNLNY